MLISYVVTFFLLRKCLQIIESKLTRRQFGVVSDSYGLLFLIIKAGHIIKFQHT